MTAGFLPYGRQTIDEDDIAAVAATLRSEWLTTGPAVAALERTLAVRVGAAHAVACNSGTAALHLATLAAEIGPGDVLIVPTITFVATANAARYVGAEVVFADVDPSTGLMGPAELEEAIGRAGGRARGVAPVHLTGQCDDPEAVAAAARRHGLFIVEDASHALGATYLAGNEEVAVGACRHADMTVFSFHPVKTLTMGEGGVVTTNDDRLGRRLAELRSHGLVRSPDRFQRPELAFDADGSANPWYYELPELGLNYRASDVNCALGLSQFAKLDRFVARRREIADRYDRLFAPFAPVLRPLARAPGCNSAWHLYVVRIDFRAAGLSRGAVMAALRELGVGSQVHYIPVHEQPYYVERYGRLELPGARSYYESALSLPMYPALTDDDVDRVAAALRRVLGLD